MRFIEFLTEKRRSVVRPNSHAHCAGTPEVEKFAKDQIRNLEKSGKDARDGITYKADPFEVKDIKDNLFGDAALTALSRKHEVNVNPDIDFVGKQMEITGRVVKKNRDNAIALVAKKRKDNGGKM